MIEKQDHIPLRSIPVHDPWVLPDKASGQYYLFTGATPADTGTASFGVQAYVSTDLRSWSGPEIVFTVPDNSWANPAHGAWAPEVHVYRNRYYLFVTLHNKDRLLPMSPFADSSDILPEYRQTHVRGTAVFVADSPLGPFIPLQNRPHAPEDYMSLDGTLYVEDGQPWMVYCHEWIQVVDGTVEAVPLTADLSAACGDPLFLFKGSDAPWLNCSKPARQGPREYVTDGPYLHKTDAGLLMLWSSYRDNRYVQTYAWSQTGKLAGPWIQGDILVEEDSGHGMLFRDFMNRLLLVLHSPFAFPDSRARIFEVQAAGNTVRITRELTELYSK